MKNELLLTLAARSDVGLVRDNNEDNLLIADELIKAGGESHYNFDNTIRSAEFIAAVCDGMGGQYGGEIASFEAVRRLKELAQSELPTLNLDEKITRINAYADETNRAIYQMRSTSGSSRGMGTTFACLLIHDGEAVAMHVGDSRVYRLRNGELRQLTKDHSENERLIRLGVLSPDQARGHKSRFILNRHFGMPPEAGRLEADVSEKMQLQQGDLFLLCSDGLTDMVPPELLKDILDSKGSIQEKADLLIQKALANGGKDNVTVVLAEVRQIGDASAHAGALVQVAKKPVLMWGAAALGMVFLGYMLAVFLWAGKPAAPDATPTPETTAVISEAEETEPSAIIPADDLNLLPSENAPAETALSNDKAIPIITPILPAMPVPATGDSQKPLISPSTQTPETEEILPPAVSTNPTPLSSEVTAPIFKLGR